MSSRMGSIIPLLVAGFVGIQSGIYIFQPTLDQYFKEMKEAESIRNSAQIGDKVQINNTNNNNSTGAEVKKDDIKPTSSNNTTATPTTVKEETK
ncbi:hypothetical protein CONCODRAFT_5288 [Conidiobolus coronatus NRRL 28638]|uniref:Uncharacterized protein n=1 Tax=Conidiobolus coronatus (strain ATCC 28846 / CBS 209.66 / NRRL 28638) TaxID=796925 RepID=A0A137PAD6_CONC2|nr:hypothetical protein CONCODRAFT_5288 [Conidiobolus coronatus NRRL 28638]|eukprot:KXN71960.1 hypothetical protein CONCODRAFT_5288 [Conidiobolus coronatus NRRL 28638]